MSKNALIVISLVVLLVSAGLVVFIWQNHEKSETADLVSAIASPSAGQNQNNSDLYTLEEISKHNSKNDCWMVIDNNVYNVSSFVDKHPGGDKILQGCGKDATEMFNAERKHLFSSVAKQMMSLLKIGTVAN